MSAALLWFFLAVAFFGVDLMAPHLVLLFFGFGALAGMCANLLGFDLPSQLIVFIVCSLCTLAILRSKLQKVFSGMTWKGPREKDCPAHPLLGRTVRVSRVCGPELRGEVEVDGSFWRAVGTSELSVGSFGRVIGVEEGDSLLLRVAPSDKKEV